MRMLRWTLGFTRLDRIRNTSIRQQLGITAITEKCRNIDYAGTDTYCANPSTVASLAYNLHVDGRRPQGRPKQRWQDTINNDLKTTGLQPSDANDNYGDHAATEQTSHQWDKC